MGINSLWWFRVQTKETNKGLASKAMDKRHLLEHWEGKERREKGVSPRMEL